MVVEILVLQGENGLMLKVHLKVSTLLILEIEEAKQEYDFGKSELHL